LGQSSEVFFPLSEKITRNSEDKGCTYLKESSGGKIQGSFNSKRIMACIDSKEIDQDHVGPKEKKGVRGTVQVREIQSSISSRKKECAPTSEGKMREKLQEKIRNKKERSKVSRG